MFRFRWILTASALALAASGCIWKRLPLSPDVDPNETAVVVSNESDVDVTLFAVDGVAAHRIGRVLARASKRFDLPVSLLAAESTLQLFIKPFGLASYRLPAVQVGGGQKLALTVTHDPAFASVAIVPPGPPKP